MSLHAISPPKSDAKVPSTIGFSPAIERHYTVAEVAILWNLSRDTIRRLFQNEPGVVVLTTATRRGKRRYRTLRIPESVLLRVHRQNINALVFHK
jgi:transcriptional regulator GlxA family with amidase domain